MNRKLFFAVMSVMLLAFFAFSYGCGTSTTNTLAPTAPGDNITPQTPDKP